MTTPQQAQQLIQQFLFSKDDSVTLLPDFIHPNLIIKQTTKKGRGLFAIANEIQPGEILLIANPLAVCDISDLKEEDPHEALAKAFSGSKHKDYIKILQELGNGSLSILTTTNSFQIPLSNIVALYYMPSFCNHACNPNTSLLFKENILILRAARLLLPDTEVTLRYFATTEQLLHQRLEKSLQWKFCCSCEFCEFESFHQDELVKLHNDLFPKINKICESFFGGNQTDNLESLKLEIRQIITEIEQSRFVNALVRSLFASAYQIQRNILERLAFVSSNKEMYLGETLEAQRQSLDLFNSTEPGSFEHCRCATVIAAFAISICGVSSEASKNAMHEMKQVLNLRYGGIHDVNYMRQLLIKVNRSVNVEVKENNNEWF